jgi:DNA-binding HxlR family transcriptional regulator
MDIDRSNCPISRASEIVGDHWSLMVLRELMLEGPRKFSDFQEMIDLSPNTLSARLKKLEALGVIERRFYSDHPPRAEYHLTAKGQSLGPVMRALYDWGTRHADG